MSWHPDPELPQPSREADTLARIAAKALRINDRLLAERKARKGKAA